MMRRMHRPSLLGVFAGLNVSIVLWIGACGGKVVAEPELGEGGAGGSTTSSVSTSNSSSVVTTGTATTTVTSSTGPSCDCNGFCQPLQQCGFAGVECPSFCGQVPPDVQQCVCANAGNCQAITDCVSGPGPGPGSGGAGGVGGGNGQPSEACFNCAGNVDGCSFQYQQCDQNPECQGLLQCHQDCGWGFECNGLCDPQFPGGMGAFQAVIECAICEPCFEPCSSSSLGSYCFLED
jgi:hypothetical protein